MNKFKLAFLTSAALLCLIVTPAYAQTPKLSLDSSEESVKTGKEFTVTITINEESEVLGADVVLSYNESLLTVESVSPGDTFKTYPNIDAADTEPGIIRISGIGQFTDPQPAIGTFATITFLPIAPGEANVDFLFIPEDSTTTGIIPLEGPENTLTIQPAGTSLTITGKALNADHQTAISTGLNPAKNQILNSGIDLSSLLLPAIAVVAGIILLLVFFKLGLIKKIFSSRSPKETAPPDPAPSMPAPTTQAQSTQTMPASPQPQPIAQNQPQPAPMPQLHKEPLSYTPPMPAEPAPTAEPHIQNPPQPQIAVQDATVTQPQPSLAPSPTTSISSHSELDSESHSQPQSPPTPTTPSQPTPPAPTDATTQTPPISQPNTPQEAPKLSLKPSEEDDPLTAIPTGPQPRPGNE